MAVGPALGPDRGNRLGILGDCGAKRHNRHASC
jgi:hypothetical protein